MTNNRTHASIDHAQVKQILIVKLSSMGDIIHVTPCIKGIRKSFPNARIDVAVNREFSALLRNNPYIDRLIACERRFDGQKLFSDGQDQYDIAIDFQGNIFSKLVVEASRSSIKTGRGSDWKGWTNMIQPDVSQHAIRVCAEVLNSLDIKLTELDPEVHLSEEADQKLRELLRVEHIPEQDFLIINPFSAWDSKDWPIDRYIELISMIRGDFDTPIIISGSPEEITKATVIDNSGLQAMCSLVGKLDLDAALCLYKRAALMISGDSGPMHAAAALGTRVIALFGPTLPERTGPWGPGHIVIQSSRPPRHHEYRRDTARKYISAIDVATVYSAVKKVLSKG